MSEMVAASSEPAAGKSDNRRRRRRPGPDANRKRKGGGKKAEGENSATDDAGEKPERPKREYIDVPADMIGTKQVGIVSVVVRKGPVRFGFILIGDGVDVDAVEKAPRIYFSFSNIKESGLIMRRGYLVTFTCKKDDKDRTFADEIELTEEGKTIQVAREERIAQRKAENPDGDRPARQKKVRAERAPPPEPRMVKLRVSCEGMGNEEKVVEVNAAQSVAKLKNAACTAFNTSLDLNVYFVPSAGLSEMTFLSREQKAALADNDRIHLAAKKAE